MLTAGRLRWEAEITVTARDVAGRVLHVARFHNLITTVGRNLMRDLLSGAVVDGEIKYVGLGSSTTAPAITQTQLVAEQFRKQITAQSATATGQVTTTAYIAPQEANLFRIEEIGWFATTAATGVANSGVMVARVLYSRQKNNLESLQIDRTDTFTAA